MWPARPKVAALMVVFSDAESSEPDDVVKEAVEKDVFGVGPAEVEDEDEVVVLAKALDLVVCGLLLFCDLLREFEFAISCTDVETLKG